MSGSAKYSTVSNESINYKESDNSLNMITGPHYSMVASGEPAPLLPHVEYKTILNKQHNGRIMLGSKETSDREERTCHSACRIQH
jgi:hypothetical protein